MEVREPCSESIPSELDFKRWAEIVGRHELLSRTGRFYIQTDLYDQESTGLDIHSASRGSKGLGVLVHRVSGHKGSFG